MDLCITRDWRRCERKMIISSVDQPRLFEEPIAKSDFPHQNRQTTRHLLHGETMSIGVWRNDARRVWSVRWRLRGLAGPANTRQPGDIRVLQARLKQVRNHAPPVRELRRPG